MIKNNIIEISSYNISAESGEFLDGECISAESDYFTTIPHEFGWFINIWDKPYNSNVYIPEDLYKIIEYCFKNNISWIYIDRDTPLCEEFNNYENDYK